MFTSMALGFMSAIRSLFTINFVSSFKAAETTIKSLLFINSSTVVNCPPIALTVKQYKIIKCDIFKIIINAILKLNK